MMFLTSDEVDALRGIAERMREQDGDEVCYGFFPGGNPHCFCPDHECSTNEERAAHKAACDRWDAEHKPAPQQLCGFMERLLGEQQPRESFGLGTYTIRRTDVDELAAALDVWLDKVREVEGRYR